MRTAAYKVDVASDRRRRENVPRHILCSAISRHAEIMLARIAQAGDHLCIHKTFILSF